MWLKRFCRQAAFSLLLALGVGLGLAGCGGGGDSALPSPVVPTADTSEKNLTASASGELLNYVKERLRAQPILENFSSTSGPRPIAQTTSASASPAATAPDATFSGTTLQEVGVDEDDLIKTDGNFIYTLGYSANGRSISLSAYERVNSGSVAKIGGLAFPGGNLDEQGSVSGMFLFESQKKIVAVGSIVETASTALPSVSGFYSPASKVLLSIVDAEVPSNLAITRTLKIDGNLVSSRRVGNYLYVTTRWRPSLSVEPAAISSLTIASVLPSIRVDSQTPVALIKDTDCYVQTKNAATDVQLTTITAIDLSTPELTRNSRCLAGGTEAAYVSDTSVYLATTRYAYTQAPAGSLSAAPAISNAASPAIAIWRYPESVKTDIHKFSLNGLTLAYVASAQVEGHLGWEQHKKSYRMSEFNGDLRVLTFTGSVGWAGAATSVPASPATLTILRVTGSNLEKIGSLPSAKRPNAIGLPNEQVYAVRLLGDRGYVVTFRQTDPLYVLDLSDPSDPKTAGELKAPGYSDYIYPIGSDLILGVGKDANDNGVVQGVKLALYDVSNPASIKELATKSIGKRGSASALDTSSRGINFFKQGDVTRIGLPVKVVDVNSVNQSLYRFEVNALNKTFTEKPAILGNSFSSANPSGSLGFPGILEIGFSRSVQVNDNIYFLHGGTVSGHSW
jgi:uncharacterized secreted protein with C-terminal beta-propeller domain